MKLMKLCGGNFGFVGAATLSRDSVRREPGKETRCSNTIFSACFVQRHLQCLHSHICKRVKHTDALGHKEMLVNQEPESQERN